MADEINHVDGLDVISSSRPRVATKRATKKVKKKVTKSEGAPESRYPSEGLPLILRNRIRTVIAQGLDRVSPTMTEWLNRIVEVKVRLSKNNPVFAGFDAEYNPNGWLFSMSVLRRKPNSLTSRTPMEERPGHQFAAMFGEATYGDQEFFPDEPMDAEKMRYPSARHLYFMAETIGHMDGWGTEHTSPVVIDLGEAKADYGISILNVEESIIERFNDARWSELTISNSQPHFDECHSVQDRCVEQLELLHTELSQQTIIPLTVETILEGAKAVTDYIIKVVGQRATCLSSPRNRNRTAKNQLCSMSNIAIEGIHWNLGRREEIEHLIVTSDLTRRELLTSFFYDIEDSANRVSPLKTDMTNSGDVSPYTFSDLDERPEGIVVEDIALGCTGLDLQGMLMAHAAETRETPEQMRKTAIYNAAEYKRSEFRQAFDRAVRLRSELIDAELETHKLKMACEAYERDIDGVIGRLEARLNEMELLESVQLSPSLKFMVTTKDVYADPHHDEDDNTDEGEVPLPSYNVSHRRYVGKYQIIFDPLEGSMHARNIAAVMAVEGRAPAPRRGRSTSVANGACAIFHPHASVNGDYSSTSVCLGSYDTDIGRTLRRITATQIEDVVFGQLRTFLLFLQTYSINDTYVRTLIGAMPETKPTEPKALGITKWQPISGEEDSFPVVEGLVFDPNIGPRRVATKYLIDNSKLIRPDLVNREPRNRLERYWPYKPANMAIPYSWLLDRNDPAIKELQGEIAQRKAEEQKALAERKERERADRRARSDARRLSTFELIESRRRAAQESERAQTQIEEDEDEPQEDPAVRLAVLVQASVSASSEAFITTNGDSSVAITNTQEQYEGVVS